MSPLSSCQDDVKKCCFEQVHITYPDITRDVYDHHSQTEVISTFLTHKDIKDE